MHAVRPVRRHKYTSADNDRCPSCRCPLNLATACSGYCYRCAAAYLAVIEQALTEAARPTSIARLDDMLASGLSLDEHPLGGLLAADLLIGY